MMEKGKRERLKNARLELSKTRAERMRVIIEKYENIHKTIMQMKMVEEMEDGRRL